MFSVLCILRTHFFDMIIGLSPVWYFLENFLLLLLPQFLLMACEVISYPNIFYREYQGFNFIYRIYFVLAVGLTVFGQCTLSDIDVYKRQLLGSHVREILLSGHVGDILLSGHIKDILFGGHIG